MEIAGGADQRGNDRGRHISRAQDIHALERVVREQARENHARDGQIPRDGRRLDGIGLAQRIAQRDRPRDVPQQQQHKRKREAAVETNAGDKADDREDRHQQVVRGRLDGGYGTGQHSEIKHREQQPFPERDRRCRQPQRIRRRCRHRRALRHARREPWRQRWRHVARGDQYAFSELSSAKGVRTTM